MIARQETYCGADARGCSGYSRPFGARRTQPRGRTLARPAVTAPTAPRAEARARYEPGPAPATPERGTAAGPSAAGRRTHLLTFALEEYFHNFDWIIDRAHWGRFERRVEHGTARVLDLLDRHGQRATFFCLGWIAEHLPGLVGEIARRGHEVASKGHTQRPLATLTPAGLRDDLARARDAIEHVTGARVLGYRAPGWMGPHDLWALDVLAAEGYAYDSSVKPHFGFPAGAVVGCEPGRVAGGTGLWEVPVSSLRVAGQHVPVGAGNYSRQLPRWLMRRAVARWERTRAAPFHLYFHAWEFDPEQPQVVAADWVSRQRFYRNLGRTPAVLGDYLARYRFAPVAEYLGLAGAPAAGRAPAAGPAAAGLTASRLTVPRPPAAEPAAARAGVTLVVPCYNEELALPYLANTLDSVRDELGGRYDLEFVFVDDCSTDRTAETLARLFGARGDCRVVRHARNGGVAQAILTGVRAARHEVVASIDCDCTYDPHELGRIVPLLADGVDLVTASPYHRAGAVRNVPRWRLALSKGASACYRLVLRQRLHTYTSCFRVYRRSAVAGLALRHGGFLGVAEMIGRLDLAGSRIVEYPTTLNVRILGHSKMKVARTVGGHLRLLAELAALRLRRPRGAA